MISIESVLSESIVGISILANYRGTTFGALKTSVASQFHHFLDSPIEKLVLYFLNLRITELLIRIINLVKASGCVAILCNYNMVGDPKIFRAAYIQANPSQFPVPKQNAPKEVHCLGRVCCVIYSKGDVSK